MSAARIVHAEVDADGGARLWLDQTPFYAESGGQVGDKGRISGDDFVVDVEDTIKGRGVSYMENEPIWHYRSPNPDEYRQALDELAEVSS